MCFISLDHFMSVLFVLSCWLPSQEIGWKERLRNDPFCVEWDAKKPLLIHSAHKSLICNTIHLYQQK